ncbi:MAG TPA: lysoplasmalogenase family protein, partial [Myxococcota bacterium]|nr:lysoplasmalogenase family protein [Myxococcota bacterium]
MARALWLLYGALAVAELAAEATGAAAPAFLLKLGLVPLLATAWALSGGGDRRVLGFFVGSWVGDVTLSLAPLDPTDTQVLGLPKHDGWFLAGVLAFAAAHLSLIAALRDVDHPDRPGPWTSHRGWFAPLVTWAAVLGQLVLPPLAADP